jgi:hypothetical protein
MTVNYFFVMLILFMHTNTRRYVSITIVTGVLLGIFTSLGQTYSPDPFKQLANSYSVWLLFSFATGYLIASVRSAALAGILVQYLAIVFYYLASLVRFDMTFTLGSLFSLNVIWLVGGTLVGPEAAVAGVYTKHRTRRYPIAIAFMAGLIFRKRYISL